MRYKQIKYVKTSLSRLIFGCAFKEMINGEDASEILDKAYESGINTFDTAENYGKSESVLGKWIKSRGIRNSTVIITKGCHPYGSDRLTEKDLRRDLEGSLERLQVDRVDVYLLHRDVLGIPAGPIVEILNEYHRTGIIGAFGGSNWTPDRIAEANDYAKAHSLVPFSVSSPGFSLAVQYKDPWGGSAGCVSISGSEHKKDREWYAKNNIPVFAYSSLAHGFLSGKIKSNETALAAGLLDEAAVTAYCYDDNFARLARAEKLAAQKGCTVSQLALAYLLKQDPRKVFPVVTATKESHLRDNIGALDVVLSAGETAYLEG
jgi:aryl-alcohol dehydrogenase-like predicted oxidoreductase